MEAADPAIARRVAFNAKMRRTGIRGAAETLLVDAAAASRLLPPILDDLIAAGCEIRGDGATRALDPRVVPATPEDWDRLEEHTSELQSLMRISYAVFFFNKKGTNEIQPK